MATEAQTATSTSQLPTGPITPESFYAKESVLLTPEDHQAFQALATTVAPSLRPPRRLEP